MIPTGKLDFSRLDAALAKYLPTTRRDRAEIANQRALNIIGRAFDALPPASGPGVAAKRAQIKAYMDAPVATRLKRFTSGARKGQFGQKGGRANQLQRKHLIVQARRRKAGKKGLYGRAMRRASGALARHAQVSVGFLKSIFLPVIRGLNRVVPYKFPFAKTSNISRWPNSAGHGMVVPGRPGPAVTVTVGLGVKMKRGDNEKALNIVAAAMQTAVNAEAAEITAHVNRKLTERARAVGWAVR